MFEASSVAASQEAAPYEGKAEGIGKKSAGLGLCHPAAEPLCACFVLFGPENGGSVVTPCHVL